MKIVFLANSHLALPALHDLLQQRLVGGVGIPATGADAPERVAALAEAAGVSVRRFSKSGLVADLLGWLEELQPTAALVFTFPWRIPTVALAALPAGWFNFHFAPLPAYRGPEPLFWLIRNGAAAGAVTLHRMTAALDCGPVLVQRVVPIGPTDTHGLHQAQLATAAVGPTRQLVAALQGNGAALADQPQDEATARYWPRPTLPDLCIDWHEPADAIHRLVRAANPWNRGAFAKLRGQPLRILVVTPVAPPAGTPALALPGAVVQADPKNGITVACGSGHCLRLDILALEEGYFTGSQMAGLGVRVGDIFGSVAVPAPAPVG